MSLNQISLDTIVSDEKKSFAYILSRLTILCPSCQCKKFYIMSRKRIRCKECKRDYNPLFATKFSSINLPYTKWLKLINLFILSESVKSSSVQAKVSYKTTLRAFHIIQRSILENVRRDNRLGRSEVEYSWKNFDSNRKKDIFQEKLLNHVSIIEWRHNNKAKNLFNLVIDYMLGEIRA